MTLVVLVLLAAVLALGILYLRTDAGAKRDAAKHGSLGKLVLRAGHEINNPLAYILTNIELAMEQSEGNSDMLELLSDAKNGVERIRRFVVQLQEAITDSVRSLAAAKPVDLPDRASSLPPPKSTARRRVLVVDDEPLICRAIQKSLSTDHDIVTTVSSRHALEQIREGERFDVIFCDLMMPEMSGMDLYEALRESAPDLLSRFVFMTGGVLDDRTRGFLDDMTNPLMEKPLRSKSVRRIVAESTAYDGASTK